eukprot:Clim_evm6s250 gene=Clim_evmTU6s250
MPATVRKPPTQRRTASKATAAMPSTREEYEETINEILRRMDDQAQTAVVRLRNEFEAELKNIPEEILLMKFTELMARATVTTKQAASLPQANSGAAEDETPATVIKKAPGSRKLKHSTPETTAMDCEEPVTVKKPSRSAGAAAEESVIVDFEDEEPATVKKPAGRPKTGHTEAPPSTVRRSTRLQRSVAAETPAFHDAPEVDTGFTPLLFDSRLPTTPACGRPLRAGESVMSASGSPIRLDFDSARPSIVAVEDRGLRLNLDDMEITLPFDINAPDTKEPNLTDQDKAKARERVERLQKQLESMRQFLEQ